MKPGAKYIRWFEEIRIEDVPLVGGKNASLGEMYRKLAQQGVRIPNGFAVTAEAYWHVLRSAGILDKLVDSMAGWIKPMYWILPGAAKERVTSSWVPAFLMTCGLK